MWEFPKHYMTPRELADLVVQSLENQGFFKANQRAHPEDLVVAFTSHAESIAIGAGYIVKKVAEKEKVWPNAGVGGDSGAGKENENRTNR